MRTFLALKMKRTKIKELIQKQPANETQTVMGWIKTKREGKKYSFIELNDGSTISGLQLVLDNTILGEDIRKKLTTGACISATGNIVASSGKEQNIEMQPSHIEIFGESDPDTFPLQKKAHSLEFLREIAHLRPKTKTFSSVLRLRHAMAYQIHHFFHQKGFYYIHTPIITGSDCEGAGEMFQVTTLNLNNIPKNEHGIDFSADFFGKPTHLTVSGQLQGELAAMGLSEIYTFGPTFRAENSNTARHLAEFWMIEPEMAFYDLNDNMNLAEELLKNVVQFALNEYLEDLTYLSAQTAEEHQPKDHLLQKLHVVLENPFERITYTQAIQILTDCKHPFEYPVFWGADLQSEHERYLVEKHFQRPVILTDYPKEIKAFYMKQNDDGKTVRAMDVLFPGIGEIIGGSQREENYTKLLQRIRELELPEANYWWYLDTRRFGAAPHSGFGLGFERLLLFITGMTNIRDVIPFPRTPKNAEF